jgi:hypothetical protein
MNGMSRRRLLGDLSPHPESIVVAELASGRL